MENSRRVTSPDRQGGSKSHCDWAKWVSHPWVKDWGCWLICHTGPWEKVTQQTAASVAAVVLFGDVRSLSLCCKRLLIHQLPFPVAPVLMCHECNPGIFPSAFITTVAGRLFSSVRCWSQMKTMIVSCELHVHQLRTQEYSSQAKCL